MSIIPTLTVQKDIMSKVLYLKVFITPLDGLDFVVCVAYLDFFRNSVGCISFCLKPNYYRLLIRLINTFPIRNQKAQESAERVAFVQTVI